jgi:hypothetical protein
VAEKRAEIMRMITRLRTSDAHKRPAAAKPAVRKPVVAVRSPEPPAPTDETSDAGLLLVLRRLESRLSRIEETLTHHPKAPEGSRREPPLKDATFSGMIQGQMLSDMLQLVSSNSMSGIFIVENDLAQWTLYIDQGRICHASSGDVTGEAAFFAAFATESGKYHFKEMAELPPERTISAGTQYLVLEALRRMDESRA